MKNLYESLKPNQRKLVNRVCRGGVNFLSGTVSPAKSDPDTMDIESFSHAMEHYAKRGVEKVVIQPKYMGSRGQYYIHKDLDKCYAVSRNGFKIDHVDLKESLKERHLHWFDDNKNKELSLVIEDGEILPWRALGDKLIEESFIRYSNLVKRETNLLESLGFPDIANSTCTNFANDDKRESDISKLIYRIDTKVQKEQIKAFDHQLSLFAQHEKVSFKPFNILKMVCEDGQELITLNHNLSNFVEVSDDKYVVVNPSDWEENTELQDFLEDIKSQELEGVMVKPVVFFDQEDRENRYAPMIKVRNPEYLRIVYGQDYTNPEKLQELVSKKSIGSKVGASLKEYYIGKKLLQIPANMLNYQNEDYRELVTEAILSNEKNEELDPRL